jgi:hypothetical protein
MRAHRLACIFLAGKTEQDFVPPAELVRVKAIVCSVSELMRVELVVLEALNFDLKVFHPHNLCALIINQALEAAADEANGDDRARVERDVVREQAGGGAADSAGSDVSAAFKKSWRDAALLHISDLMVRACVL